MKNSRNESVLSSFYHDAFIHTEDKKIFNVHKVILATHSPFLHNYFQSRPGHDVKDIFFQNAHSDTVKSALELMYNGKVSINTQYLQGFKWFVETILCVNIQETEDSSAHKSDQPSMKDTDDDIDVNRAVISDESALQTECIFAELSHPIAEAEVDDQKDNHAASSIGSAWTLTSISADKLTQLRHSVFTLPRKGRRYKCDVCGNMTNTLMDASNHFLSKHQNSEEERKQLESAMMARKNCLVKIGNIKKDLARGCNVAMATSQLDLINDELNDHLNVLYVFDKTKLLPENLSRKTRELCRAFNDTITEVKMIVKEVDNK
jgi:hypothetical protein